MALLDWQDSNCCKALGCLFALTACSIGIAALIFALISYRKSFLFYFFIVIFDEMFI
jgi:hypothetical protein